MNGFKKTEHRIYCNDFFFFYEQIDALGICILVGKCMQSIV